MGNKDRKVLGMKVQDVMQGIGFLAACIGAAGMDSEDQLFPICFMIAGGLLMRIWAGKGGTQDNGALNEKKNKL